MLETFEACNGIAVGDLDSRAGTAIDAARANGIGEVAARGVWHVLRRWMSTVIDSPIEPRKLRAELLSGRGCHELACSIATRHKVDIVQIRRWLYADLSAARIVRPKALPPPDVLRGHYNMSLAQGLLGRCTRVSVRVPENVRAIVRSAKLKGLLVGIEQDGPTLVASGPLALFRHTTKYANALATFLPALVTMPSWSLEGDIILSEGIERLSIDSSAPLPRDWALPQRTDSGLEERLMKSLLRLNSGWKLKREPLVLRAGRELFFPDFVLERGADRVVVEVVGFWTPDYLERKVAQLNTIHDVPLVVCVDEHLACDPTRIPQADVLHFRRSIDANALLDAAERAVERRRRCA